MGIDDTVLRWITNFLAEREQRVMIQGCQSRWRRVWSGVPQGSVLGPTLFLIYIDDLLEGLNSSGKLFADDAKVYRRIRSPSDMTVLQNDIHQLQLWTQKWLLSFNEDKCKVMHFGAKNPANTYFMGETTLTTTVKEEDLGVLITPDLKVSEQVTRAAAAANSMLGRIRKTFTYMDKTMFLPIYKTLVRPHMEYAIQVWSPFLQKDIIKLEKVQQRATKLVPGLADLSYPERLARLHLTTLEERRTRGDMIEVYKLIHGIDKVNAGEDFLKLETDINRERTHGHPLKLQKPRHRLHRRNQFFSTRVVDKWNQLPEHVVLSKNVNTFKGRYDKHMDQTRRRGSIL